MRRLRASHPRSVGNGVTSEGRVKTGSFCDSFAVEWEVTLHPVDLLVQHFLHILRVHKRLRRRLQFGEVQCSVFLVAWDWAGGGCRACPCKDAVGREGVTFRGAIPGMKV